MKKILIALSFLLFGTYANADCNIKSGSINILANDFPALRTLVETAKECKGSADFKVTHSAEHNKNCCACINSKSIRIFCQGCC